MSKFKQFILCSILIFSASADALKCASEFNTTSSSRKWMSFDQAKALMQSQGIRTFAQFQEWSKSEQRPKDFPSNPNIIYKDKWTGWSNFLGTGNIAGGRKKEWMSFDQAKTLMQSQGIRTFAQFQEWSKSKKRPKDFPSTPQRTYKNEWRGWRDFLGAGNISVRRKKEWMSFDQAQALMQSQGIRTREQFQEWSKSEQRPKDFPSHPERTYKDKWRGWRDFLGTGNISVRDREWMSFQDAKALIQSQGIRTHGQFREWSKSGQRPENFPSSPNKVYTNKWRGWGDFLGAGNISTRKREKRKWMSFQDAKAHIQSQGIRTHGQFQEWSKSEQRPKNFPSNPNQTYKNKWTGWRNFLGTGNISVRRKKEWMSFQDAKVHIQSQSIRTLAQFQEWSKSEQRPKDFPSNPQRTYKNEWKSWKDFLGTKKQWMSFHDAKALMQSQGIRTFAQFQEWSKSKKRPKDFPSTPQRTYKNEWTDWRDFLGAKWMSFDQAKALMQSQGIKTSTEFRKWKKDGKRPKDFPSNPPKTYKNEWRSWEDFLGTGNISTENSEQAIFEARAAFLRQKISTDITPEEEKQASNNPENFSNSPDEDYKDEQTDPDNFLESETTWMSFDQAKAFIQQLGITNQRDFFEEKKNNSDIFPENFPPNPKAFYTNTGEWIDWNDFLGLTNKSHNKINNSGENSQIERDELGQEDIFTDAEEGSEWGEDVEI